MGAWLKAELHTHTAEDPYDGRRIVLHDAKQLIDKAHQEGFDVLSITNHNQVLFSRSLIEYARRLGVTLIPGVEATLEGKHVLLYNFPEYRNSWNNLEILAQHKGEGQLVVAPHPFFPTSTALGKRLWEWPDLFDAIEYNHFYLPWLNFNRRAEEFARSCNLPLIGNSDVHHLFQLGHTYSLIYADKTVSSVIRAIKRGRIRLVTRPVSSFFILRWFGLGAICNSSYAVKRRLTRISQTNSTAEAETSV